MFNNSYDILHNRITDRGYAITSLTGTYVGMFTRDSAIQAMAHLEMGDKDSARAILNYLLSYHATLGLERATHIIDQLQDEEYGNNYLTKKGQSVVYYDSQREKGVEQFLITAPDHAAAIPFLSPKLRIDKVSAYIGADKGATIIAEIYTDLTDPSTLLGKGSLTLEKNTADFLSIPLESTLTLPENTLCYLKLYATKSSGRVVLYGINGSKNDTFAAFNYDPAAYGGNGWRQVDVSPAFVIGQGESTPENFLISQRKAPTGIYAVTAPSNGAAQPFIPRSKSVFGVELHLNKSQNTDKVEVFLREKYDDPATTVGKATYTFGEKENGWQTILFEKPVEVTPGKTYYLVVQATKDSGKVIWNGTTDACGSLNSFNFDQNAWGGWEEKPYYPAFEILSFPQEVTAQGFEARGNTLKEVELTLLSPAAKGKITVEIRTDYTNPATTLGTVHASINKEGESRYLLSFDKPLSLQYKGYYYLVVTLTDAEAGTRLLSDPASTADSLAFDGNWQSIGYRLLAEPRFEVDSVPLITLQKESAAYQEIPTDGETVSGVKVLLSKEEGAKGSLIASFYRGEGESAKLIDKKTVDLSAIGKDPSFLTLKFDLPYFKDEGKTSYFLKLEMEGEGKVFWCGSSTVDNLKTYLEQGGKRQTVAGEAGFEALTSKVKLISNYTQTDANYMLLHAFALFASRTDLTAEEQDFVKRAFPTVKTFANYYLDKGDHYNEKMNLLFNPSLEHSRKIRYWQSYDLLTNVFASQALYELSPIAKALGDGETADKWSKYASKIEQGIKENLITEVDGKKIYGEFYDAEDNMKFYPGISWVNLAPVAAEWYATDLEIMKNTYEIYKKYASVTMYGHTALATEATLGTNELTRELIGKGLAWELMLCHDLGDTEQIQCIVELVLKTAEKNHISVYPEFWKSESYVTDPGNQEHCSWQVYAMCKVFSLLTKEK